MFKKLLIVVVAVFVLAAAGGGLWAWQGLQTLKQPVALGEPVLFNVPAGTGFSRVARQLENEGYVSDALWLRLYGRLYPDQTRIKAGDYEFLPGMTPVAMVDAMVEGKVKLWSVQFIEGWTFRDMRAALARSERLKRSPVTGLMNRSWRRLARKISILKAGFFRIPTCSAPVSLTWIFSSVPTIVW